jgi:hypothetical protein
MTVSSGGQTVTLGAGEFTQTQSGSPPTMPGLPPPGFVQQQLAAFQSAAGQTGGARAGAASAKNIASAEQKATGSPGGSVTGSGAPPTPAPPTIVGQINAITSTVTQSIQTSNQAAGLQQIAQERPSVTLTGYVGGLDVNQYTGVEPISGTSEVNLDATTNRVQARLDIYAYDSRNPFTQLANTIHALLQFGSTGSTGAANGAYVDYNNFYANTQDNYVVNGVSAKGVISSANGIATNQVVTAAIPNLTPCQCDYTRWGFWAISSTSGNTNTAPAPNEVLLGTWVAGRPVGSIGDVPTTGQATYTGHVIANMNNSAVIAAGNFSNTVDFGARNGQVSVTNLDSTNYSGTVYFNNDPRNFGGTIDSTNVGADGRSMALQGSFFQGARSPVGEMGGSVAISSTKDSYLGSGIFAASRR